jgi:hypothetical protein
MRGAWGRLGREEQGIVRKSAVVIATAALLWLLALILHLRWTELVFPVVFGPVFATVQKISGAVRPTAAVHLADPSAGPGQAISDPR